MSRARPRLTLSADATVEGRGLFTERQVRCLIGPAGPGEGITLRRTDAPGSAPVAAHIDALCALPVHAAFAHVPPRHTALGTAQAPIYTTEHVLAALAGLGVTDAAITLDGPELPILDGSALPYVEAILGAGLRPLGETVEALAPETAVTVRSPDGRAWITAEPIPDDATPTWRYELDYGEDAPIAPGAAEWGADPDEFVREIAPARTFCLHTEATQLRTLGLFGAFAPSELLVINQRGEPIDNRWRLDAEPARHKLLDLLGDLALVGRPLHARVTSRAAGHALNHVLARELLGAPGRP